MPPCMRTRATAHCPIETSILISGLKNEPPASLLAIVASVPRQHLVLPQDQPLCSDA